jgi:diguanylate cyclase
MQLCAHTTSNAGQHMPGMIFPRQFAAGEDIFRLGDRGLDAYIIERGKVAVSSLREGESVIIAELGKGEMFGEMSVIDDAPRSATVTAIEDTEVIVIQQSRFIQPLTTSDPLMNLLLRIVLKRFRDAQDQLSSGQFKAGEANEKPSNVGLLDSAKANLRSNDTARARTKPNEIDPPLEEIRSLALHRINAERDIRQAMEAEEFELHYQPIVTLDGGHIAGFEGLMRWRREDGEYMSPLEFIPIAEDTGQIAELGHWALKTGLRDHLRFARRLSAVCPALPQPFMSINVSSLQFSDLAEIDLMATIIDQSGVDPANVKLEMTETLLVKNVDYAADALKKLKRQGVSIAIDDFGTGYSGLSNLHQFPIDTLKIDRAFVNNMDKSEKSGRIVSGIARLALALEMDIIAEGIEERAQYDALLELGCQYGQGYYFAKPLSADKTLELIESRPAWQRSMYARQDSDIMHCGDSLLAPQETENALA